MANQTIINDCKRGCLLGNLVGDALGAVLEFAPHLTPRHVQAAMRMTGGGQLGVGPGQITDDGELTLCLAHALAPHMWQGDFPAEEVAAAYSTWYSSRPFDVGNTCATAFAGRSHTSTAMRARASASSASKANGALMRCAPIALWVPEDAPDEALVAAACADALLSHPNRTCQDASAAYCLALWHLVNHPGDADGAMDRTEAWAAQYANGEVKQWLRDAHHLRCFDPSEQIGFVRWGFTLAFHHLQKQTPFAAALQHTLSLGGDTDTNAAIVGAMLGALHGARAIPEHMVAAVMSYSYEGTQRGFWRPRFLTPKDALPMLAQHWAWLHSEHGGTPDAEGHADGHRHADDRHHADHRRHADDRHHADHRRHADDRHHADHRRHADDRHHADHRRHADDRHHADHRRHADDRHHADGRRHADNRHHADHRRHADDGCDADDGYDADNGTTVTQLRG